MDPASVPETLNENCDRRKLFVYTFPEYRASFLNKKEICTFMERGGGEPALHAYVAFLDRKIGILLTMLI